MEFSQSVPGKELQVVFAGYQLENDEDGLYILLNESAKSEAEIRWIQPVLETAPTVNGTVTGGTALRDVEVTGGRAVYKVAANAIRKQPEPGSGIRRATRFPVKVSRNLP